MTKAVLHKSHSAALPSTCIRIKLVPLKWQYSSKTKTRKIWIRRGRCSRCLHLSNSSTTTSNKTTTIDTSLHLKRKTLTGMKMIKCQKILLPIKSVMVETAHQHHSEIHPYRNKSCMQDRPFCPKIHRIKHHNSLGILM